MQRSSLLFLSLQKLRGGGIDCLTHLPYAPWCEACVRFRGNLDFCFTARADGDEKLCCLVVSDSHSKWVQAWPVKAKGGVAGEITSYLGYQSVTVRADSAPSCNALRESIKALRLKLGMQAHIEQVPKQEHQANYAESAIARLRQHAGTILHEFEESTGTKVGIFHPLHAWAWRHSGWLLQRYDVQQGLTAWERVHQVPYSGKVVRFGEAMLARVRTATKGKPRWMRALWLGKADISDSTSYAAAQGD